MRLGYIEATEITSKALVLADILGFESMLQAVKGVAFQYMNPSHVKSKAYNVCRLLDEAYGGIMPALKKGIWSRNLR